MESYRVLGGQKGPKKSLAPKRPSPSDHRLESLESIRASLEAAQIRPPPPPLPAEGVSRSLSRSISHQGLLPNPSIPSYWPPITTKQTSGITDALEIGYIEVKRSNTFPPLVNVKNNQPGMSLSLPLFVKAAR